MGQDGTDGQTTDAVRTDRRECRNSYVDIRFLSFLRPPFSRSRGTFNKEHLKVLKRVPLIEKGTVICLTP